MDRAYEKALFLAVSGLEDEADIQALLDGACKDDPAMRERIESLFKIQTEAESYFDAKPEEKKPSTPEKSDDSEELDTRIGRYRIIDRVGDGGFGVVYFAEQTEPVRRKVALKIVRPGIDTEHIISRFEMERQTLALMDHPNIARVLDAGSTASGRPFFVMQLVDGTWITKFCDENRIGLTERIRMFIAVCKAIQHAHQKGIIHCDIKPSNILITMLDGAATPKVIDFGIAKAMEGEFANQPTPSAFLSIGTPAYMSLEQVDGRGLDIDSRSDIYSLGVVLYELLTGSTPRDPKRFEPFDRDKLGRMLRRESVLSPSESLKALPPEALEEISTTRRIEPAKLLKTLRGDLDAIVMKAMQVNRQDRYATANELAAELSRYLNHEPITASKGNRGYRLRKLVQRNKVVFAVGTVAVVALAGGFGVSTWLFFAEAEAKKEQERLTEASNRARALEAELRKRAEAGEAVSQAAVWIRDNRLEEANALVEDIELSNVPNSLEAADTFRAVGEWLLPQGRLEEAAKRFAAVAQSLSTVDKSNSESISIHFVAASAALVAAGDLEHYEELRQMAATRFSDATHPFTVDEILKTCLIIPPDPDLLERLNPMLKLLDSNLPWSREDLQQEVMEAWQMLSLTLGAYRNGEFALAESWARRGLQHPNISHSRDASLRAVLAMALYRSGREKEGYAELSSARRAVDEHFEGDYIHWTEEGGYWFDWYNARILCEEAEKLMGDDPESTDS
ncbi:hypothetical protein HAHE_37360 [Haloferula helveola]|uniref:Protein kinase domain-containing protein n=1 Tax=Haloferula helveola TaxID=490095 RepID=A0ABM7RHH1_9BACT|nr:hypothetical protein HAHE_37360 [Haloferula helveola]